MVGANSGSTCFLKTLDPEAEGLLRSCLVCVELDQGAILEKPGERIGHLFLLDTAVVSFVAIGAAGQRVEIGTVGYGGATGIALTFGSVYGPNVEATVEVRGAAWRLSAEDFARITEERRDLRQAFLHLAFDYLRRVTDGALAMGCLSVQHRVARWLLTATEAQEDTLVGITHERLAELLCARRSSVTVALHKLEGIKVIRVGRSRIEVDRERLSFFLDQSSKASRRSSRNDGDQISM
jgi:CRP-like cAMP-binding protein